MTIPVNARVKITRGEDELIGRVEEIMQPAVIFHAWPELRFLIDKMEWAGVTRVARISYYVSSNQGLMFTAFEMDGEWFDLELRSLAIEVVGMYGCAALA